MTLEIQDCFLFSSFTLLHMSMVRILQLQGNFSHIWLETLKKVTLCRDTVKTCSEHRKSVFSEMLLPVQGQNGIFSSIYYFLSQERRKLCGRVSAGLTNLELWFYPHSFYFTFFIHQDCRKSLEFESCAQIPALVHDYAGVNAGRGQKSSLSGVQVMPKRNTTVAR